MELYRYLSTVCVIWLGQFFQQINAQTLPINWGPLESKRGALLDILPIRSADFYALRYNNSLFGSYRVNTYNQLAYVSQQRIKPVTETGFANIETSAFFAGKFQVFLSDRSGTSMALYSQSYLADEPTVTCTGMFYSIQLLPKSNAVNTYFPMMEICQPLVRIT